MQLREERPVEKAMEMVERLLKQMEQDQKEDDVTYEKKRGMAMGAIKDIEENVDVLGQQLKETNSLIMETSRELIELIQSANSLTKQMKILDGKDQELRENRSFEAFQFNKAKSRTMKILGALKNIINLLTDAVLNDKVSLLERDELMRQIKEELGEDDPVVAMIEITKR